MFIKGRLEYCIYTNSATNAHAIWCSCVCECACVWVCICVCIYVKFVCVCMFVSMCVRVVYAKFYFAELYMLNLKRIIFFYRNSIKQSSTPLTCRPSIPVEKPKS